MKHYLAALAVAILTLTGCTDTPEPPAGRGSIRAVDAVADAGAVSFLIEARQLEQLDFQDTSDFTLFDSLEYDFNFDFFDVALDDTVRLGRTTIAVAPDTDYTIVLAGTALAPRVRVWQRATRFFEGSETIFELYVGHLAASLGNVDVYLGEPGFTPLAATPSFSAVARESVTDVVEFEQGTYEVVITTAGDPADELFRSDELPFAVPDTVLLTVHDSAGENTGDVTVVLAGRAVRATLVDTDAPTLMRFANAARAAGSVDVVVNDDFATPFASGVAFAAVTALGDVPGSEILTLTTTPAGNSGVTLTENELAFEQGSVNTAVLVGDADALATIASPQSPRPLFNVGKVSLVNASTLYDRLDVFITEPGADLAEEPPRSGGVPRGINIGTLQIAPGEYELTLTDSETDAVVFGPVPVTVAAAGLQALVIANAADGTSLELLDIGPPQP